MPTDEEFLTNNRRVIATFRANAGTVDGLFPVLLLTTTGARTGRRTTSPLAYGTDQGTVFVVASKAGAPTNPAWFHNVRAHPQVTVEIGAATYEATAAVAEPGERERLYAAISAQNPLFAKYEQQGARTFPVVILAGVAAPVR
jgi:deazaflavin-dependent oxidoreductase (nitroreductase family)